MKKFFPTLFFLIVFINTTVFAQFHDYSVKYGIQGHLLEPRTEFDTDSYVLSLLGRGFLRMEINSFLEAELGVGIGELNGKDFQNDNWRTQIYPTDIRLIFSPLAFKFTSTYLYAGFSLLRWNITNLPKSTSPNKTKKLGWDSAIPVGGGIEILLSDEILLNITGGYTFAMTDNLNYYSKPKTDDGYFDLGLGLTFVFGGGKKDEDGDGLSHSFEKKIGTNPRNKDTDGDTLFDGDEINIFKTNPLSKDSDNDKLSDFAEIHKYGSDPNSEDTDGDDISDYDEVLKYYSNPTMRDSDKDGLSDGYEINIYSTNPVNDDTDSDNLKDKEELKKYKTDPNNPDTDGDGLTDGEEIHSYKTDPLVKDAPIKKETTNNISLPIKTDKPIILEGISFETDKAEIKTQSEEILNKTLLALKKDPTLKIEIRGYTDNVGNSSYNKKLSQQRADAVRIYLVKKGIDALRIKATGYGEKNPIASNNTIDGRNKNRRIEIIKIK